MEAVSTVVQRFDDTGDRKEMTRAMADVPAQVLMRKSTRGGLAGRGQIGKGFKYLFSQD